jgi:hypothetical protein
VRCVVLVPWRPGEFRREYNWDVVRPRLESLGWPIYLGDSEGDWARARAINNAARVAGDWDCALISDADTILMTGESLDIAIPMAMKTEGAIRPHDHLYALSSEQTAQFVVGGQVVINFKTTQNLGGGHLVVSRAAWDRVGGYDERFVTWGHEDSDLNTRLLVETYWDQIPGVAYHLWHPRDTTQTLEVMRNRTMMRMTQSEYANEIRRESIERGWDIGSVL